MTKKIHSICKNAGLLVLIASFMLSFQVEARNVQFEHIRTEDGLSQSDVTAIAQDHLGYMWYGTQEGLNRYDGYEIKVFEHDPDDPTSISSDWIWSLLVDHKGQLWIGTNQTGLSRYDYLTNTFTHYTKEANGSNGPNSNQIRVLFEDSQNFIWVGTKGGGLTRFNPELESFEHFRNDSNNPDSLPSDDVNAIYESLDGTIWIGTASGIAVIDPHSKKLRNHSIAKGLNIRALTELKDDIWVGTESSGVLVFNRQESKKTVYLSNPEKPSSLPGDFIRDFLVDDRGTLWIATDNGLAEWMPVKEQFNRYKHDLSNPHSLSNDRVESLFQDVGGVLWIGTYDGINSWNYVSDAFSNYKMSSGHLNNDLVTSIVERKDGSLYVGTYGGGVNLLTVSEDVASQYYFAKTPVSELKETRVMSLEVDSNDNLWIGTLHSGLYYFDSKTHQLTNFSHDASEKFSISANGITALLAEEETVWIGTYGGGLNRYDIASGQFVSFRHDAEDKTSLGSDRVFSIYRSKSGELWVGTDEGGLNLFDQTSGKFTRYRNENENPKSLSNDTVTDIFESGDRSLWIGTLLGGLNKWSALDRRSNTVKFAHTSKKEGLKSGAVWGILESEDHKLWVSGNRGIFQFDTNNGSLRHFDARNGLSGSEFSLGARLKTSSNTLIFGGTNGIVAFNPKNIHRNTHVPPIVVSAVTNSESLVTNFSRNSVLTELAPSYNDRFVDFRFAALDYTSPDKNQYRYKLEGFDLDWIDSGKFRRATYTNLPPGNYRFVVRASNNDNVWNEVGTGISLKIVPPPWKSAWAYTLYFLLLVGGLASYVIIQQKKLAAEGRIRKILEDQVVVRTSELAERNSQLEEVNEQLTEASMSDALTGLQNRRYLYSYLERELASLSRLYAKFEKEASTKEARVSLIQTEATLFFMMIDLDGFKQINDTYGHAAGDQVLIQVRDVLQNCTRDSDTIIRWGGDEFLIAGHSVGLDGVVHLAERIRKGMVDNDYLLGGGKVGYITGSIGFAQYPFNPFQPRQFTWEQTVALADQAAYVAKDNGKNAWVGFSGSESTEMSDIVAMREDLQKVINSKSVRLVTSIERELDLKPHVDKGFYTQLRQV